MWLCARKTLLKNAEKMFIKPANELLNIKVNFRNLIIKLYFIIYILSLNDDSIFNVTVNFIADIMESFFIHNLKEIYLD